MDTTVQARPAVKDQTMPEVYARSRAIVDQLEAQIVRLPEGEPASSRLASDDLGTLELEPPD